MSQRATCAPTSGAANGRSGIGACGIAILGPDAIVILALPSRAAKGRTPPFELPARSLKRKARKRGRTNFHRAAAAIRRHGGRAGAGRARPDLLLPRPAGTEGR